ncbi:MAG: ATPase, partial [Methanosphaera sp. rholeuAM74]
MNGKDCVSQGKTALGIEFGSTRIKGVLIDYEGNVLATGTYDWENSLVNGIWTYGLDEVVKGLQGCYAALKKDVQAKYDITPTTFGAIGISAMMHGYITFDGEGNQLAPFRTWRNT